MQELQLPLLILDCLDAGVLLGLRALSKRVTDYLLAVLLEEACGSTCQRFALHSLTGLRLLTQGQLEEAGQLSSMAFY
jgi:hypothetical protein